MIAAALATVAASAFGVANFLGGIASKRDTALAVTANAHLFGAILMGLVVLAVPAVSVGTADVALGALAGVTGGLAVVALYAALALGRMGVVAPVAAAVSAALPALYDVLSGTELRLLTILGVTLALVAVFIVSASGDEVARRSVPLRALVLATVAGTGFAIGLVAFSLTSAASGFTPLLVARVVSAILLGAITVIRSRRYVVRAEVRAPALGSGALESLANVAVLTALRIGPLAVVSVLAAMHPVITLLAARVYLGERLVGLQRAGVALALFAVLLTALPQ